MNKNILFITWDGPQTNYTEGLFMPIFQKIEELNPEYKFHYLQFTWGNDKSAQIKASKKFNIPYASAPIKKKTIPLMGSIFSLINGKKHIKKYVKKWNIDVLMPRSTFPAFMVRQAKLNLPIIFDADGLPIEERIDFAGMKRGSILHKLYKSIERKAINNSNLILTRSQKSINYHLENYKPSKKDKFFVVSNGRNIETFKPDLNARKKIRTQLGIPSNTTVFVYAGSFGPQYGWEEMLQIFKSYDKKCLFLFLTGSPEIVKPKIPENLQDYFIVKRVPFEEVPDYLSAADIAFAIREPKLSMQGVAPIKLGEYLIMGLPTISSKNIGDTDENLKKIPGTFLYDHDNPPREYELYNFFKDINTIPRKIIRESSIDIFSLEAAAKSYICALKYLE